MATDDTPSPCPGGCTEGAMCPGCFARHEREVSARQLRAWLLAFGASPLPANDVRSILRVRDWHGRVTYDLVQAQASRRPLQL